MGRCHTRGFIAEELGDQAIFSRLDVTEKGDQRMFDDDTRDRAEIHDLFNRYADAVSGRQWKLLDEVFTEDVTDARLGSPEIEGRAALVRRIRGEIERSDETHLLCNYTAAIDGDVAEASVRFRVYQLWAPGLLHQKILGFFRVELVRTGKGWRFRHFGPAQYAKFVGQELFTST